MARGQMRKSILSLKSWLFTPATKSDRFGRAAEVDADAFIIDLEDAVAPRRRKMLAPLRFAILHRFLQITFLVHYGSIRLKQSSGSMTCRMC